MVVYASVARVNKGASGRSGSLAPSIKERTSRSAAEN